MMDFRGVFAPIPTPFDERDRLDLGRLRAMFPRWLDSPLDGFVVLGSTGEAVFLDESETDRIVEAARELVPASRRFVVGTGRESTQAAARAARRAAELGAEAVLVRTPGFFKSQMTTEVLVRHYRAVADASPVPVLLYNFTAVTGVNLLPAAVARLADHRNIVGVKESGGDVAQIADFVSMTPHSFTVLAGSAGTFFPALTVGASGGILALSCLLPEACCRLYRLTTEGKRVEALALQQQLVSLSRLVGSTYGVPGLKAALRIAGIDAGVPRPPLMPLADAGVAALREALSQLEDSLHESPA
jgi:4-hydroxy-2-oxoglutarate aldolase